jgi:DNA processing protein
VSPANISNRSAEGILTLLQLAGVGLKSASRLVREFPTLDDVHVAAETGQLPHLPTRAVSSLRDPNAWIAAGDRTQRILEQATKLSMRILTIFDEEYPTLLRSIPDSPLLLYIKGQLRTGLRNVACIGTREPSRFGRSVTRRLVGFLVERQWGIVAGLARGIDAESHRTAIAKDGYTLAVLGNGLDKVFPAENRKLAEEIVERGGALVSEQPFGVPPKPINQIQACRVQSGMSVATVVMQTDLAGGSMHTVRSTLTQGRLLVAPAPHGKLAEEPQNRGLIALTKATGAQLAERLGASGDYRRILLGQFAESAPAFPVRSRADYPELVRQLGQRLATIDKQSNGWNRQ